MAFKDDHGRLVYYPGTVAASHKQGNGKVLTKMIWDTEVQEHQWEGALYDLRLLNIILGAHCLSLHIHRLLKILSRIFKGRLYTRPLDAVCA